MTAVVAEGVYRPQHDSWLLVDALARSGAVAGRRVVDLCTGSGVVAVAAAKLGARAVTALDISPDAVRCAQANAVAARVLVDVRLGPWHQALDGEPYDIVVCNPPYVPSAPDIGDAPPSPSMVSAWNGGTDGRLVLGPLCGAAADLLAERGSLFLVHSEFAGVGESLTTLRGAGLRAEVSARQRIPFGPVLDAQAGWLRATGRITAEACDEELVVIRADKP
ncbi:HemK2/MTQ2 family protein methyltransferase [Mycobacterium sp. NPDC003449]